MYDQIKIFSEKEGEIFLSPALPSQSDPGYISGIKSLGANGPFGYLLMQEITGKGYCIRYHNYFLNEEDNLTFTCTKPALWLCLALKNSFHYTTKEFGDAVLHERAFNISYTPFLHRTFHLQAKQPYTRVDIFFSLNHLKELSQHFPFVENFLHKIKEQEPALLNNINHIADQEILSVMEDMLYCSYPLETRKTYIDSKITELLILTLERIILHPQQKFVSIPEKVIQKIYEVRELLVKDLHRNYTLEELAARVGLNPYMLKKGFMAIYELNISDFLHTARMQKAQLLLEETGLPVSQVATDTGYVHPFAFSSAFKKHFGYAPSMIQRSRKCTLGY